MGCIFVLDGQGVRAEKGHVEGDPLHSSCWFLFVH